MNNAGICGSYGTTGDGSAAINAKIGNIAGIALDSLGTIYISDGYNYNYIREISFGMISRVAGVPGGVQFAGDGSAASSAYFNSYLVRLVIIFN